MFKDTPSQGLVCLQFLSALGIFFDIDIIYQKWQLLNYIETFHIEL